MEKQPYEKWKVASGQYELVKAQIDASGISVRIQSFGSTENDPVTMPREQAELLAIILRHSHHIELANAKAVKA